MTPKAEFKAIRRFARQNGLPHTAKVHAGHRMLSAVMYAAAHRFNDGDELSIRAELAADLGRPLCEWWGPETMPHALRAHRELWAKYMGALQGRRAARHMR